MAGPYVALAVWQQVPVANRLVEVNTKTGFSLTAGSYSVRASSTQSGAVTMSSDDDNTAAISAVTINRCALHHDGNEISGAGAAQNAMMLRANIESTTTVRGRRQSSVADTCLMQFNVLELF